MNCAELVIDWDAIRDPACSILIEPRMPPISDISIEELLREAPFSWYVEGTLDEVQADLITLPGDMRIDISNLGSRFMKLMHVDKLRVRIEGVTGNACKKLHADYTDLRLITTYAGAGTDYAPQNDRRLERMPTGAVGLFKGKLFGNGHTPCLHRSPPIEGTNEARLVLVIDTPEK